VNWVRLYSKVSQMKSQAYDFMVNALNLFASIWESLPFFFSHNSKFRSWKHKNDRTLYACFRAKYQ